MQFTPEFYWLINSPDAMLSSARLRRLHNRISKEAARLVMREHQLSNDGLKDHFKAGNWRRYQHMPRKQSYLEFKRRGRFSPIDLVKRGRLKRSVEKQSGKVTVGGTAPDIRVTLRLTLPFGRGRQNHGGVDSEQIAVELSRWTVDQVRQRAKNYQRHYLSLLRDALKKSPRLRKKLDSTGSLGL